MGLFTALAPLLKHGDITLTLKPSGDEGKVKVIIAQTPPKDSAVKVGFAGTEVNTPEVLDATLTEQLTQILAHREGPVQSLLEQAKAQMDEAAADEKRAAQERTDKARKKGPLAGKPGAAGKSQKFSLSGAGDGGEGGGGEGGGDDDDTVGGEAAAGAATASGEPEVAPLVTAGGTKPAGADLFA